jgi:RimJ/RimL family protein N-acetyltransferase
LRLVWGLDQVVAEYVSAQFPIAQRRGGFKPKAAVGIADDTDTLVGGIVMTDWRGHDGCLSIYFRRPALTDEMIAELCHWAFRKEGMKRLTAEIAKKNKRARRFVEHVGFRLEGTLRHGWHVGNDDMCIYGMTADACNCLERK